MWNTCTGQWCGSKYEQAYRDGYEQGWADQAKRITDLETLLTTLLGEPQLSASSRWAIEQVLGKEE